MSTEYRYDRESDSFRPVENKKNDTDWGSWVWIAIFFAVGLWPIGLIALISKLKDSPRKSYTSIAAAEKSETKVVKTARKVTRTPTATDATANVLTIVGLAVTGIFGIGLFSMIGEVIGYGWTASLWEDIFSIVGFLAGGIVTLAAGRRMKRRTKRIARYLAIIGERDSVTIDELAVMTGRKRRTVEDDLEYMIEKGMLGMQAYVDSGRGILFRSADAAQRYTKEKAEKENLTPKEANEGYAGALRAIRYANDRIADAELSKKIDHLETVTGRIFREVEAHPEKQAQATTFFNYYLPTTLKILNTYAEFEDAGIRGENLQKARERIEATMDTLIRAFDKQLDDLYRNEAMDIDSDIRVMENMLRRDISSVEEDFGLGGAAAQRCPDEE